MNNINWQAGYFTTHGMIPEAGEELTFLWGRKIVDNYVNLYGITGTVTLEPKEWLTLNLGLTRKFWFPPVVNTQNYNGALIGNYSTGADTDSIVSIISGDAVLFHNNNIVTITFTYRIKGV